MEYFFYSFKKEKNFKDRTIRNFSFPSFFLHHLNFKNQTSYRLTTFQVKIIFKELIEDGILNLNDVSIKFYNKSSFLKFNFA